MLTSAEKREVEKLSDLLDLLSEGGEKPPPVARHRGTEMKEQPGGTFCLD